MLTAIPGIGPKLAQHILTERSVRGRFQSYEEAQTRICGLGAGKVELLRRYFPRCE